MKFEDALALMRMNEQIKVGLIGSDVRYYMKDDYVYRSNLDGLRGYVVSNQDMCLGDWEVKDVGEDVI